MERLFGTKEMWISKKQKLDPCKFNKHLFLKNLFEFRSSLRGIFFEKKLLREGYTVKFFFQGISWNTNFTSISTLNSN